MSLSAVEQHVIASLPDIDPERVGEIVGVGAQCLVRSYDGAAGPQVIKLPLFQIRRSVYAQTMGRILWQRHDQAQAELDICAAYFGPFMVPTRIVADANRKCFCILQDRVQLTAVTKETLAHSPHLDAQLGEIMKANRRLIAERGLWLDAMGWKLPKFIRFMTRGTPYLENVGLDPGLQFLRLFDFGLFPTPHQSKLPMRTYYHLLFAIQKKNMGRFGHSFGPTCHKATL